jgi:type II secretory pathway pseudopilin PulG
LKNKRQLTTIKIMLPSRNIIFNLARNKQRGAALMVMLIIMVLGLAAFLVSALNSSSVQVERNKKTADALAQAKNALLAYAVSDTNRPGDLPCPDANNDGVAVPVDDYVGNSCVSLIGRLPWRTLGLPDLRDSDGERLWYAISDPFNPNAANALNSDTVGILTVNGNIAAANVIAIVFSPGHPLPGQVRSASNINMPSAFLESVVTTPTVYRQLTPNDLPRGAYTYNDQLLMITHDDVFPSVEKAVAKQFKNLVTTPYYTTWGTFPFASSINTKFGLLPVTGQAPIPDWASISGTGDGNYNCSLRSATAACTSNCISARCNLSSLAAGDTIRVIGAINKVGMGFWRPYNSTTGTNQTASCTQEVCVRFKVNGNNEFYPASSVMNNVQITYGGIDANGNTSITFIGTVKAGNLPDRIQFSTSGMPDYSPSWLTSNNWHQVMYYAASPGYIPSGGNSCTALPATPSCLTVKGNGGITNAHATVIMAGNTLAPHLRPSVNVVDYLEGENATPVDFIYENKTRSSTFNDQVVVVSP